MSEMFASLHEQLLRAGVRPKAARRYIAELRDHFDDLMLEMEESGHPTDEARQLALARLGDIDALALPMVSDRRFHGLAGKAPWAVFLVGPVFACTVSAALGIFLLIWAAKLEPSRVWFDAFHFATQFLIVSAFPILLAWAFAFVAMRQRCRLAWVIVSALLSIAFAAGFNMSVTPPSPNQPGEFSIGVALPSLSHLLFLTLLAMTPTLLGLLYRERTQHVRGL